jgi:hypothetical protein
VAADDSGKAALLAVWRSSLDLQGYWQFLAVGSFVLVVAIRGLRRKRVSPAIGYLGIAVVVLSVLATIGSAAKAPSFLTGVVATATVIGPLWYVSTGLALWRRSASS